MSTPIEELVRISPAVWPGEPLAVQPGDLSRFAPMGFAQDVPVVIRPWDRLEDAFDRPNYYGAQSHGSDPIRDAPTTEPAGGVVYFDSGISRPNIDALLLLMRVQHRSTDYSAFLEDALDPPNERFLRQMRIVSRAALFSLFGATTRSDAERFEPQPLTVGDLIWAFIEEQQERYGLGMSPELRGTLGGDGDWAKEALAFGFMVENNHWGIYRLWSRAWLVTK